MEEQEEYALTTIDNPYNPFTHYDEWLSYDTAHGYDTNGYLARITKSSNDLSDVDESIAIQQAIDEIVRIDLRGIYIKVKATFVTHAVV